MLSSKEILNKYLNFYKERGHVQIPNMSLMPQGDSTLLFVNSGMFPLVPYLSGQPHPLGKRLVNVQRSLRFDDLENVGNTNRHTVAFHMIGNWSLGDYFKKEQLPWVYQFFIEELGLDPQKIYASVFAGDENAPKDTQSVEIIKEIFAKHGIDAKENERIFAYGKEDNWWKRGDTVGELGGPDSEIYYYIGREGTGLGKNPAQHQDEFLEIGNSVFMQYKKREDGGWDELSQKNVDFGGGLERIALAVQHKQDIFQTDNFWPIVQAICELTQIKYGTDKKQIKAMRCLADHMRATTFLIMDEVVPLNKDQGYILRRLIRRMIRAGRLLGQENIISQNLVRTTCSAFEWLYPVLPSLESKIIEIYKEEYTKFAKTLGRGSKEVAKIFTGGSRSVTELGRIGFDLYQSVGYPFEIFMEDIKDHGLISDTALLEAEFQKISKAHQEQSRVGAEKKFKGGLAEHTEITTKYHTATHVLLAALRQTLGSQVVQMGSNITNERLRFDFPAKEKLTDAQISTVEQIVRDAIAQALPVKMQSMPKTEAEKTGALHQFGEKYGDTVNVYFIGDSLASAFSKEFCGGPHVKNTSELAPLKIYKQEKIGENVLRVYARF